jgi:anaerobic ribonucleoside-triphosphate reductase activating protein
MSETINIIKIIRGTTVDGPGFRTSIYFAGCRHRCEGCHNPQSWDFSVGTPMTQDKIMDIVREEDFDVTFSGGDPLYHPVTVRELADKVHECGHNVWLYTGYTWEEILSDDILLKAVSHVDVVVDSPFILALRDTDLLFRGSSNQRIIDVAKSLDEGKVILWQR